VLKEAVETAESGTSSYSSNRGDPAVGKLPGIPSVGESKWDEVFWTGSCNGGKFVVIFRGSSAAVRSVGVASSGGRLVSLDGEGTTLTAAAIAAAAAAAMPVVAASASILTLATTSNSFFLRSAAARLASLACESRIDLLYASLIVSLRCAKSIGPTDILRRRAVASSGLGVVRPACLDGDGGLGPARILDAVVVAVATDCLGRELRRLGESLGVGPDTYALSRPLLGVAMLEGGGFREDPGVWFGVGVFVRAAGVADRLIGVFARAATVACGLDERLPLAACFKVAGELDRVEVGLVRPEALFIFFIKTGRRDVGDVGDVGEASSFVVLAVP